MVKKALAALGVILLIFLGQNPITTSASADELTGTVTGFVASAVDIGDKLNEIKVTNDRTDEITYTTDGSYELTLPIGDVTLGFTDENGQFIKVRIPVTIQDNETVNCNVSMMPIGQDEPSMLYISPLNPIVTIDELKQFEAHTYAANGAPLSLSPVWSLTDNVEGGILGWDTGLFSSPEPGTYSISASVGQLKTEMKIKIIDGPKPAVLYVGNDDNIISFLVDLGFDLTQAVEVPPNLSQYDVVVADNPLAVSPYDKDKFRDFLAEGKGLVLSEGVPEKISGGKTLTTISDWFGASVTRQYSEGSSYLSIDYVFALPFKNLEIFKWKSDSPVLYRTSSMDQFCSCVLAYSSHSAFAFTHTYGTGRVYYQAVFDGGPNYPFLLQVLGGGVQWCAKLV